METITKFLSLLVIYIFLVHHKIDAQELSFSISNNKDNANANPNAKDLINKACEHTQTKDLCIQVLSSDPTSGQATKLEDLVMISLKVASANASSILTEVKTMIDDDNLDPGIQQGLSDCKETLLDAEGQLEDTIAALLANSKDDAQLWLQAALAAIDTCDASIPGDDDVLSKMSVGFRKLCNIAVALSKALPHDQP